MHNRSEHRSSRNAAPGMARSVLGMLLAASAALPFASAADTASQPRRGRPSATPTPVSLFSGTEPTEPARSTAAPLARWIALSGDLKPTSIRAIVSVSKTTLSIIALAGDQVELPMTGPDRIIAVVPAQWWLRTATPGVGLDSPDEPVGTPQPSDAPGVLFCADGQRIPGFLITTATLQPARPSRTIGGPRPNAATPGPGNPRTPRPNVEPAPAGGPTSPATGDTPEPAAPTYSDEFRWMSQGLGEFTIKLEQAKRLVLIDGPRLGFSPRLAASSASRDVLSLVNGDRAEGFLAGMLLTAPGEATVKLEPEQGSPSIINVPRIRSIELATPPAATPAGLSRVILRSGADLFISGLAAGPNGLTIENTALTRAATPKLRLPIDQLVAFLPEADVITELAGTLAPAASPVALNTLAARPHLTTRAEPALLFAGEVELPGWCTASLQVPAGSSRIAMQLVIPESCRDRAECTVTLRLGGQVLSTVVLNAASPAAELNLPLTAPLAQATPLLITLADGPKASGPVQDQVIIRRPLAVRSLR